MQREDYFPNPVCKWVELAIQRQERDLIEGPKRGLYFDEKAAQHAVNFFTLLKHSKGEWSGQSFQLSPWQVWLVSVIFGWKKEDGYRRFRTAYLELPRKNGKSTLLAGIGLYLLLADREAGAEVYSAATKKDQAKIIWSEAKNMLRKSGRLGSKCDMFKNSLYFPALGGKFEPLGADADTLDGLNVHGALLDEIHAHKTRLLWDVLETASGSRRQSLLLGITTAGFDQRTICGEQHIYTRRILEQTIDDDSFFGFISTIDDDDDWREESSHIKANLNWGISVKPEDIKRLCLKAQNSAASQNSFKRLRLNVWTKQSVRWLNMEKWKKCEREINWNEFKGRVCYGGLDLAKKIDIAAFALIFPWENEIYAKVRFYIPEDRVEEISADKDRNVDYTQWAEEGELITTPGTTIDYDFIEADILDHCQQYDVQSISFDPWDSTQLVNNLEAENILMIQQRQGWQSQNEPTKKLEELIISDRFRHDGNRILTWMADNIAVREDPAGNIKPDKKRSSEKIDGIVAIINALARWINNDEGDDPYKNRGLIST